MNQKEVLKSWFYNQVPLNESQHCTSSQSESGKIFKEDKSRTVPLKSVKDLEVKLWKNKLKLL